MIAIPAKISKKIEMIPATTSVFEMVEEIKGPTPWGDRGKRSLGLKKVSPRLKATFSIIRKLVPDYLLIQERLLEFVLSSKKQRLL